MATEILNNCNFDATRIVKLYLATQVSTGGTINFPVNYHTLSGTSDSIIKYESWDATNIVQIGNQLIQFNEVLWVDENISFNEELIIDQRGRNYVKTLTFELSGIDQTLVDQLEALGLDYEGMLCPPKTLAILIDENENELIAGYDFPFRLESITTGINGDQNSITLTYISNSHSRARNAGFPTPSPSPTPSITPSISLSRTPSITPSISISPSISLSITPSTTPILQLELIYQNLGNVQSGNYYGIPSIYVSWDNGSITGQTSAYTINGSSRIGVVNVATPTLPSALWNTNVTFTITRTICGSSPVYNTTRRALIGYSDSYFEDLNQTGLNESVGSCPAGTTHSYVFTPFTLSSSERNVRIMWVDLSEI